MNGIVYVFEKDQWEQLQRSLALKLSLFFSAAGWLCLFEELAGGPQDVWMVALILAAAILLPVVALSDRLRPTLIGLVQVTILIATVYASCVLLGHHATALLLIAPTLLACLVLPPWVAALLSAAGAAFVLSVPPVFAEIQSPFILVLALVTGATILAAQHFRTALRQAWHETEDISRLTREVRLRQQEVNQLNKALRVSNGLLKRSLAELAIAQREAEEARHLKEQFATTVSHHQVAKLS